MRRQYAVLTSVDIPAEAVKSEDQFLLHLQKALLVALVELGILTQQQYHHALENL